MNEKFLKLATAEKFMSAVEAHKKLLFQDLINNATNDVIFLRRFRIISQLDQFESQALLKIFHSNAVSAEDYAHGLSMLLTELNSVASKNA